MDEFEQVDRLLCLWYDYESSYRVALGAPRVSPSCRGHIPDSGDVHSDGDDIDARLDAEKARDVEFCVDQLAADYRYAIQHHMRVRSSKYPVFRHPRLGSPEQAHAMYQEAKICLWPILKRKGMVR